MKQPALFIPHGGGPCFFMDPADPQHPHSDAMWQPMQDYLAGLIADLPERPRAILLVSGHWETPGFTVHDGARPSLLFDYFGFPPHTYQLRWDAPGAPALADRAAELLEQAGFPTARESERGWDHGVFIPMKVALPDADIPVAQLSLRRDLDPAAHIAAGRALAPLRDEGVLIVGSGDWVHNLRANPAARIEIGTDAGLDEYDVVARELPDDEREATYPLITAVAPVFAEYQAKTSRVIPLFELVRA